VYNSAALRLHGKCRQAQSCRRLTPLHGFITPVSPSIALSLESMPLSGQERTIFLTKAEKANIPKKGRNKIRKDEIILE